MLKYLIRYFWLHYLLLVFLGICWVFPKYRVIPNISGDPIPKDIQNWIGLDQVMEKIMGSGRIFISDKSDTCWALAGRSTSEQQGRVGGN